MNALRLSAGSRRLLAETSRTTTTTNTTRLAAALVSNNTTQRRSLHADAPFLFSLPTDPEAAIARTAITKPQGTVVNGPTSAPARTQATTATPSSSAQRVGAKHPDAPYILSIPPEFDHVDPTVAAGSGAAPRHLSA